MMHKKNRLESIPPHYLFINVMYIFFFCVREAALILKSSSLWYHRYIQTKHNSLQFSCDRCHDVLVSMKPQLLILQNFRLKREKIPQQISHSALKRQNVCEQKVQISGENKVSTCGCRLSIISVAQVLPVQPFPPGEHKAGSMHTDTTQLPSCWWFPICFSRLTLHIARSGYVAIEAKVLYSTKLVKEGGSLTG